MLKKIRFILPLFVLGYCKPSSSKSIILNKPVQDLVSELTKEDQLESEFIGYAGVKSKQFEKSLKLRTIASETELFALTRHESKLVRLLAFRSLVSEPCPFCSDILVDSLNLSDMIHTINFDVGSVCKFAECLLNIWAEGGSVLDDPNRRRIARLLFKNPTVLRNREIIFTRLHPDYEYYDEIKDLVSKRAEYSLLIPLAKYNRSEDVPIFLEQFKTFKWPTQKYLLEAMTEFRRPEFLSQLGTLSRKVMTDPDYLPDYLKSYLYDSIAKYHNSTSDQIIAEALQFSYSRAVRSQEEDSYKYVYTGQIVLKSAKTHGFKFFEVLSPKKALKIRDFFTKHEP